jgi:hypothetical protein
MINAKPISDPETERPVKTFQVIISYPFGQEPDTQHYFAYKLFSEAKYVNSRFINSMPLLNDELGASEVIAVYEVTCTYKSMEEISEYYAYGDSDEDFND